MNDKMWFLQTGWYIPGIVNQCLSLYLYACLCVELSPTTSQAELSDTADALLSFYVLFSVH